MLRIKLTDESRLKATTQEVEEYAQSLGTVTKISKNITHSKNINQLITHLLKSIKQLILSMNTLRIFYLIYQNHKYLNHNPYNFNQLISHTISLDI